MLILTVRRVRSNLTPVGLQQPPGSNRLFRGSMCPAGWGHTQECSSSPSLPSTLESQLESPNSATCKQQTDNGYGSQARRYIMSPAIQVSEYSPEAHSSRQTDACCHTGDTRKCLVHCLPKSSGPGKNTSGWPPPPHLTERQAVVLPPQRANSTLENIS